MFDENWGEIIDDDTLSAMIWRIVERLGMSGFVFAYTPVAQLPNGQPGTIKRFLSHGVDQATLDNWYSKTTADSASYQPMSHNFDPVRGFMVQRMLPRRIRFDQFLAQQAQSRNVAATNWLYSLINIGVRESFYTPVFTGRGEFWSLGALRHQDNPETEDLTPQQYAYLNWVTTQLAWICIDRLGWRQGETPEGNRVLTQRELDCLFWTAQGHTSSETAEVLAIKTETARKHIKNAIKKLNARNKTQAVVIAHKSGILSLT